MRLRDWILPTLGAGAAVAIYGALVESKRLTLERKTLRLKDWPERLRGYRIAVLSDMHVRDEYAVDLTHRAIAMALAEEPDIIAIPGDFIDYWHKGTEAWLAKAMAPIAPMSGKIVAVPGNHDYNYRQPNPDRLLPVLEPLGIRLLRNEIWEHDGIYWVGIDSAVCNKARIDLLRLSPEQSPAIALWHEPDLVALAPQGCLLQISGHSHGGQFRFPNGYTPMHSHYGKRYPRGWYPKTMPPLYVTRGVGTTGPPTRWNCPPEVSLLTLVPL